MPPLVDSHTHLFPPAQAARRPEIAQDDTAFAEIYADPKARMAPLDDLLAALDRAGIDKAVVAGFAFSRPPELAEQNRYLVESQAHGGGRIAALATLNLAHEGWRSEAEQALAADARGFGELRPHNQGWDPLGAASHALCDLAAAHEVPLLWHVSEPVGHAYPGKHGGISPVELIQLAQAHPATAMVAAHLGGGLSFYLEMPEVARAIENVYFDTAAVSLLYSTGSVARLATLAGERRVLFASDYPLLSPLRQLERVRAVLHGSAAQAVCGGNADSLYFASPRIAGS